MLCMETADTLKKLLQLRAELLAILRAPDANRRLRRGLLLRRTVASEPLPPNSLSRETPDEIPQSRA